MKKLLFASILLLLLLSACGSESLVSATVDNYSVVTKAAQATIAPTRTSSPTPNPTEVPLYVGLSVEEIEIIREECSEENAGSLCLPLPFEPEERGQFVELDDQGQTYRWFVLSIPLGTKLFSPLSEELSINGSVFGSTETRFLDPSRQIEGVGSIDFGYGPFSTYNMMWVEIGTDPPEPRYLPFPSISFTVLRGKECIEAETFLRDDDFKLEISSGQVSAGDLLGTVNSDGLCLRISHNMLGEANAGFYDSFGVLHTYTGDLILSNFTSEDLLTDEFGSIVFVLSN